MNVLSKDVSEIRRGLTLRARDGRGIGAGPPCGLQVADKADGITTAEAAPRRTSQADEITTAEATPRRTSQADEITTAEAAPKRTSQKNAMTSQGERATAAEPP